MLKSVVLLSIVLYFASATLFRPLKLIAYPYIPDLQGDGLTNLKDFLEDRFLADTGRRVDILFDFTYATDTYSPELVKTALTTGGFDMQEIDTIILGYLINNNVIRKIPDSVNFDGFAPHVVEMVKGQDDQLYAHPSYTCTNVFFSYDQSITGVHSFSQLSSWMSTHRASGQLGWTGDLSSGVSLRTAYLDGWLDSHPNLGFFPTGYSPSSIDMNIVDNLKAIRDTCKDGAVNHCMDGVYYYNADKVWFTDLTSGHSLLIQGFPEYFSELLALNNANVNLPTNIPTVASTVLGAGSRPYLYMDAFVISRTNCDLLCQLTARVFLNWQRTNWAQLITLGKDLTPNRPRFLSIAYEPFYYSEEMDALPGFAKDAYHSFHYEIARARGLDTIHYWANQDSQAAALAALIA